MQEKSTKEFNLKGYGDLNTDLNIETQTLKCCLWTAGMQLFHRSIHFKELGSEKPGMI